MSDSVAAGLEPLLARFDEALGGGYTALLYGAAARGAHLEGRSEVSVLLILDDVSPTALRRIGPALAAWHKSGHPAPLLLSRREWQRSSDAFPVEIADIQSAHRILRGADPMSGVKVSAADLRGALERDLAAGLMRLRQSWALHADDPKSLGAAAQGAAAGVVALLRGLLSLAGRPSPEAPEDVARLAGGIAGFAPVAMITVIAARRERAWKCPAETFEGFLAAVDAAAQFVDRFTPGDR